MTIDPKKAKQTPIRQRGTPDRRSLSLSSTKDGGIVTNRGEPWQGRDRVAQMAAGFFADVPDLKLVCDGLRCAGDHVVYLGRSRAPIPGPGGHCAFPDGRNGTWMRTTR
jgi:hypothetical protein